MAPDIVAPDRVVRPDLSKSIKGSTEKERIDMASQKTIEKMYARLRKKFWKASDTQLVWVDVMDEINDSGKYDSLTSFEQSELFRMVVTELDGEQVYNTVCADHGNIVDAFTVTFPK